MPNWPARMAEWPAAFTRQSITTPSGPAHVWSAGEGAPLWCLHGFPDTAETWLPLVDELLAAGYAVHIPVMPGYASDNGIADYRVPALAQALLECMDALTPERPLRLIGHDWGAVCAYALAALAPQRIEAMVCAAVPHLRRFLRLTPAQLKRSWYMGFFQLPRLPERKLAARNGAFIEQLWRDWSPSWAFGEADIAPVKVALAQPAIAHAALAYYRALPGGLLDGQARRRLLGPCGVPTLAIAGARDGCIGPAIFADQQRYFSAGYRLEVLDEAGHFMHREQPRAFMQAVLEHLA